MSDTENRVAKLFSEPMSFQDHAFIAAASSMIQVRYAGKKRQVTCDIQGAWDVARAMNEWRNKMQPQ